MMIFNLDEHEKSSHVQHLEEGSTLRRNLKAGKKNEPGNQLACSVNIFFLESGWHLCVKLYLCARIIFQIVGGPTAEILIVALLQNASQQD